MLRDVAVARIQQGLGFRSSLAAEVILQLQEEQRRLERGDTLPDFLMKEDQTLSLTAGNSSVNLPADFLRRHALLPRYTPAGSTISQTIPWRYFDEAYQVWADADRAGPKVAVLRKSTVYFLPVPDVNYTVTWTYYQKDALLTSNIENLWLANAPEILIGGAGRRMAADARNAAALQLFTTMLNETKSAWFRETVEQAQRNGPMRLGANA